MKIITMGLVSLFMVGCCNGANAASADTYGVMLKQAEANCSGFTAKGEEAGQFERCVAAYMQSYGYVDYNGGDTQDK